MKALTAKKCESRVRKVGKIVFILTLALVVFGVVSYGWCDSDTRLEGSATYGVLDMQFTAQIIVNAFYGSDTASGSSGLWSWSVQADSVTTPWTVKNAYIEFFDALTAQTYRLSFPNLVWPNSGLPEDRAILKTTGLIQSSHWTSGNIEYWLQGTMLSTMQPYSSIVANAEVKNAPAGACGEEGSLGDPGCPGAVPEIPAGAVIPLLSLLGLGMIWLRKKASK